MGVRLVAQRDQRTHRGWLQTFPLGQSLLSVRLSLLDLLDHLLLSGRWHPAVPLDLLRRSAQSRLEVPWVRSLRLGLYRLEYLAARSARCRLGLPAGRSARWLPLHPSHPLGRSRRLIPFHLVDLSVPLLPLGQSHLADQLGL